MACAEVATAKAKAAKAINLIIVFLHIIPFEEQDAQLLHAAHASARLARAREGKDRREQTTSSARRGVLPTFDVAASISLMGSPTKNWSKLLTR
jgi:hypothetical protein